jgi:import inner membrane translocase subunit TIM16
MSLEEAKKILGVETLASREELLKRYNHLFRANDEHGSFYLTSKVFRARERIEEEMGEPLETTSGGDSSGGGGSGEEDKGPAKELDEGGKKS